ncbi:unnamed protein product, partial [Rotaria magnacalcarata]
DEGKDDGRPMKLPSGLKSIGVGLSIAGNPLRASSMNIIYLQEIQNFIYVYYRCKST